MGIFIVFPTSPYSDSNLNCPKIWYFIISKLATFRKSLTNFCKVGNTVDPEKSNNKKWFLLFTKHFSTNRALYYDEKDKRKSDAGHDATAIVGDLDEINSDKFNDEETKVTTKKSQPRRKERKRPRKSSRRSRRRRALFNSSVIRNKDQSLPTTIPSSSSPVTSHLNISLFYGGSLHHKDISEQQSYIQQGQTKAFSGKLLASFFTSSYSRKWPAHHHYLYQPPNHGVLPYQTSFLALNSMAFIWQNFDLWRHLWFWMCFAKYLPNSANSSSKIVFELKPFWAPSLLRWFLHLCPLSTYHTNTSTLEAT